MEGVRHSGFKRAHEQKKNCEKHPDRSIRGLVGRTITRLSCFHDNLIQLSVYDCVHTEQWLCVSSSYAIPLNYVYSNTYKHCSARTRRLGTVNWDLWQAYGWFEGHGYLRMHSIQFHGGRPFSKVANWIGKRFHDRRCATASQLNGFHQSAC